MHPFAGKRALDVTLVVLTFPAWGLFIGLLALLVLICDGSPIFLAQPRLGGGGRPFRIWKLRSMTTEPGPTGLAQVCGARGASLTAALDAHNPKRWTVRLDLAILLRTAWINLVGKRRGARPLPPGLA